MSFLLQVLFGFAMGFIVTLLTGWAEKCINGDVIKSLEKDNKELNAKNLQLRRQLAWMMLRAGMTRERSEIEVFSVYWPVLDDVPNGKDMFPQFPITGDPEP